MTCEELKAKLNSQKAALLRLQAEEAAYYAAFRLTTSQDLADPQFRANGAYADYLSAKADYERAAKLYADTARGVRG